MKDVTIFLKGIRRKRLELRTVQETAAELRAMLLPAGVRYDKDRVQTSVEPEGKLLKVVSDLMEIEQHQELLAERLSQDILRAEQLIGDMTTPEYRELIRLRYLTGGTKPLTWEQIADQMGYSADHVRGKLHGKAIAEARRICKENTPEHIYS